MSRRYISLVLAWALLAWCSGFLLSVHLHEAGPGHDSQHCEECLLICARTATILDTGLELVAVEPIEWPAPAASASVVLVRTTHLAFTSRGPPAA